MATNRWIGGTTAVTQVETYTPANVEIGDIFTLTATSEDGTTTKAISYTAGAATVKDVVEGLTAAWNASLDPLCTGITATEDDSVLTLTADSAGVPFYVAPSTTNVGGGTNNQTLTRAVVTANIGPRDFNTAANWSGGVPVDTNDVVFESGSWDLLYGLYQTSVDLNSLMFKTSYTGMVGQATIPLNIRLSTNKLLTIGESSITDAGTGSTRINLNLGTNKNYIYINNTSTASADTYKKPVRIVNDNTASEVYVRKGQVSLCDGASESGNFAKIEVSYLSNRTSDALVIIGSGVTINNSITQTGGTVVFKGTLAAAQSITVSGGTCELLSLSTIANLTIYQNGTVYDGGQATISTINLSGRLNASQSRTDRTYTTINLYSGFVLELDKRVITITNPILFKNCDMSEGTLTFDGLASLTPA